MQAKTNLNLQPMVAWKCTLIKYPPIKNGYLAHTTWWRIVIYTGWLGWTNVVFRLGRGWICLGLLMTILPPFMICLASVTSSPNDRSTRLGDDEMMITIIIQYSNYYQKNKRRKKGHNYLIMHNTTHTKQHHRAAICFSKRSKYPK